MTDPAALDVDARFLLLGLVRYQQADAAIRRGQLPPAGRAPVLVAAAVGLVAVALVALSVGSTVL